MGGIGTEMVGDRSRSPYTHRTAKRLLFRGKRCPLYYAQEVTVILEDWDIRLETCLPEALTALSLRVSRTERTHEFCKTECGFKQCNVTRRIASSIYGKNCHIGIGIHRSLDGYDI